MCWWSLHIIYILQHVGYDVKSIMRTCSRNLILDWSLKVKNTFLLVYPAPPPSLLQHQNISSGLILNPQRLSTPTSGRYRSLWEWLRINSLSIFMNIEIPHNCKVIQSKLYIVAFEWRVLVLDLIFKNPMLYSFFISYVLISLYPSLQLLVKQYSFGTRF